MADQLQEGPNSATTSGLFGLLNRHRLLIAVCAVLGATLAVLAALFAVTPSYSAKVKLYVSGTGATASERLQNGEYALSHVVSYAGMSDSNDVLVAVRDTLGLPQRQDGDYRDLADKITASNPLGTLIIDVTVEDSSPHQAQVVAAAIGQVYNSVVARIEGPTSSPVRISVVNTPALPIEQDSPSRKLYAAFGLLAGVGAGAVLAWIIEGRPTTRRRGSAGDRTRGDSWSWLAPRAPAPATPPVWEPVEALTGPVKRGRDANGAGPGEKGESDRTSS